jgi:3-methyl-2-oxobutanoate hydroxymethyltransferase
MAKKRAHPGKALPTAVRDGSRTQSSAKRVTVPQLTTRKVAAGALPITALTAYDATFARLFDRAGVDVLLVGDSVATVVQGLENTIPVTLDEMIYHCRCVTRVVQRALVVGDMPFLSYQTSPDDAVRSAGRLLKEGAVAAVKLEGGLSVARTIERLVSVDIPVMGHVGLTPQSYHRMGGHRLQGRERGNARVIGSAERIILDAKAVAAAGAFAVVVEGVPAEIAAEVTASISVPTIGIGAGVACDGQILVGADLLGLNPDFSPRFVRRFAELGTETIAAAERFISEVHGLRFPGEAETMRLPAENQTRATRPPIKEEVS